jgi:biopolymer transport protein ExbD
MANTFKNYTSASVGTGATTTYTVPSSTTSVMIGCNLANRTTSSVKVDVQAAGVYVIKGAPIPSGSALSVLDGKIILETTDTVVVTSDTASSCDVIVSVLEQT